MKLKQTIKLIIIGTILVLSIFTIPNDIIMILRNNYYLKINSTNESMTSKMLSLNDKDQHLSKIQYAQGLGDYSLYLYYTNGTEKILRFNEGPSDIKNYIIEHGYSESTLGKICLVTSLLSILICILYLLIYYSILINKDINNIIKHDT